MLWAKQSAFLIPKYFIDKKKIVSVENDLVLFIP